MTLTAPALSLLAKFSDTLIALVSDARQRRLQQRALRDLLLMDDFRLDDMGISRADILDAVARQHGELRLSPVSALLFDTHMQTAH